MLHSIQAPPVPPSTRSQGLGANPAVNVRVQMDVCDHRPSLDQPNRSSDRKGRDQGCPRRLSDTSSRSFPAFLSPCTDISRSWLSPGALVKRRFEYLFFPRSLQIGHSIDWALTDIGLTPADAHGLRLSPFSELVDTLCVFNNDLEYRPLPRPARHITAPNLKSEQAAAEVPIGIAVGLPAAAAIQTPRKEGWQKWKLRNQSLERPKEGPKEPSGGTQGVKLLKIDETNGF
jgi:hypothetical protein